MSLPELNVEVAKKLSYNESILVKLKEMHQELRENAQKIEQKIHEASDRQVEALRARERQLIRQIQVVTYLDGVALRSQEASLMQKKGALTATQELLQRCSYTDAATLTKIKVEDVEDQIDIQCLHDVMVEFDEASLSTAISNFGLVQFPERITHHTSPVIPTSVEEYDDEEHDVLHKSVAGEAGVPGAPLHVTVQFPRLATTTWLANHVNKDAKKMDLRKDIVASGSVSKSDDVASWLTRLQLSEGQEDDDFLTLSNTLRFDKLADNSSGCTSDSSSIEIVDSHFGSDKDGCRTPASGLYEIENLHLHVNEKSRWLTTNVTHVENVRSSHIDVGSACQANETCESFNDCVCQNKCKEAALEKIQQSLSYRARNGRKRRYSESESVQPILAHMKKIITSENSSWLIQKGKECQELPVPLKRVMYQVPSDQWLRMNICTPQTTSPRVHLSTHSNIWLLKNMKMQKMKEGTEKEDHEKENFKDEKNLITAEDLTEALKNISVKHESNTSWVLNSPIDTVDSPTVKSTTKIDPQESDQPWLLSRNFQSPKFVRDNRLEEKEAANKKQWLSSSSKSLLKKMCESSEDSPLKKKMESMNTHGLPESILSLAQSSVNSWLIQKSS